MLGQIGEGVDADRRDLELSLQGTLVERFDVLELVDESKPAGVELVVREGIEHERVVGIRTVPDANCGHGGFAHRRGSRRAWVGFSVQRVAVSGQPSAISRQ